MYNVVKVVDLVKHFSESCQRQGLCDEKTFPHNFIGIIKEVEKYVLFSFFLFFLKHVFTHNLWDSEFVRVAEILSQCRGKTKFEQFKRGLARNDMVREINRCDRHMNRIFERFMVSDFSFGMMILVSQSPNCLRQAAMVVDIRFHQLLAEKAQSTSISMSQAIPMPTMPTPSPTSLVIPFPNPTPISSGVITESPQSQTTLPYPYPFPQPQVAEPLTLAGSQVRLPSAGGPESSSSARFVLFITSLSPLLKVSPDHFSAPFGLKSSLDVMPS